MLVDNFYLGSFLKLKCSGDVLNAVGTIANPIKEISESMAVINIIRPPILDNPMKYSVLDLCAGNSLTSVIAAHLFPIKHSVAVDVRKKKEKLFRNTRNFYYVQKSIYDDDIHKMVDENTIIISVHPCQNLARRVIQIFNNSPSPMIVLMPCCNGNVERVPNEDKYLTWCRHLYSLLETSNIIMTRDEKCLSEKNNIIIGKKK